MIEYPEAVVLARQLNETVTGKLIQKVIAAQNPHKFAWYNGLPENYPAMLEGKKIGKARSFGSWVELKAEEATMAFCEGVNLGFYPAGKKRPLKHQLLVEFEDGNALCATIQMYGGLYCFYGEDFDNKYYSQARQKPGPLSPEFDLGYFLKLATQNGADKLSAKAFLATNQRIPGLGNGVLQDILLNAKIHPKRKISTLSQDEFHHLFNCIKNTLALMVGRGGRDTGQDLFGTAGGYNTKASKKTAGKPCCQCGSPISKESYMGGSIYYCQVCQPKV